VARAHANIALVKYWGKRPGEDNTPATPSISLALDALTTETVIERVASTSGKASQANCFTLNGVMDHDAEKRVRDYSDLWRELGLIRGHYRAKSSNNFPTKAGLASSSSGFAALAVGLKAFSKKSMGLAALSRLARRGSGSAARSVVGGLASLPTGINPAARAILPAEKIPWGMVVVVSRELEKSISSSQGMEICRRTSAYYRAWVRQAAVDYRDMLKAIRARDFSGMGHVMEANALAMHGCMMAARPPLVYWNETTLAVMKAVENWRKQGLETFFTVDAGPPVALLCRIEDLDLVAEKARVIEGVRDVIVSRPGGPATIVEWN